MKNNIHPKTYPTLYIDGDHEWTGVCSTKGKETREIDGMTYYVMNLDISAFSHPFFTGTKKLIDTSGRVDKFMKKYSRQMEENKKIQESKKK